MNKWIAWHHSAWLHGKSYVRRPAQVNFICGNMHKLRIWLSSAQISVFVCKKSQFILYTGRQDARNSSKLTTWKTVSSVGCDMFLFCWLSSTHVVFPVFVLFGSVWQNLRRLPHWRILPRFKGWLSFPDKTLLSAHKDELFTSPEMTISHRKIVPWNILILPKCYLLSQFVSCHCRLKNYAWGVNAASFCWFIK